MRRTWLFVPGADAAAHAAAERSGADVLILELEDFTPPELRPKARALAAGLYDRWRRAGALAAVRINPFETCGRDDLAAVLAGKPDLVLMSKVETPEQVRRAGAAAPGVDLVPNVESASGLLRVAEIARASPRVTALLVASEDMVADLGTERSRGGEELAYVRAALPRRVPRGRRRGDRLSLHVQRRQGRGRRCAQREAPRLPDEEPGRAVARASRSTRSSRPISRARARDRRRLREGEGAGQGARQARRRADRGADLRRG